MTIQQQIDYHYKNQGLGHIRMAMNNASRYQEASSTIVTICHDIMKFTGESAQNVFHAVAHALDDAGAEHAVWHNVREAMAIPASQP